MCSASLDLLNGSLRNARRRIQWGEGISGSDLYPNGEFQLILQYSNNGDCFFF